MAIRSAKLGGSDLGDEAGKPSQWNDTFDTVIDNIGIGHAQNAYSILKEDGSFANRDNLFADIFTANTGVNATINTGTTTASYDANFDAYYITDSAGTPEDATANGPTRDTAGILDFTFTAVKAGIVTQVQAQEVAGTNVVYIIKEGKKIAQATMSSGTATFTLASYTTFIFPGDVITVKSDGGTVGLYTAANYSYSGTNFTITSQQAVGDTNSGTVVPLSFTPYTFATSDEVVKVAGTWSTTEDSTTDAFVLDGNEKAICIYFDADIPESTSITVDATDGTTTVSAQAVDAVSKSTGVFSIESLGAGTLKLDINLTNSTADYSPVIRGYGIYVWR